MLSYKLKHLCSRVIASLSAVGLFSITGTAKAANYDFGETITTISSAKTFRAAYAEDDNVLISCLSASNDAVSGVVSGVTAGGVKACSYILKKGFVYYAETGTCLAAGLSGVVTNYFNNGVSCTLGSYSGNTYGAIFGTGIASYPDHVQSLIEETETKNVGSGQYVVTIAANSSGEAALDVAKLGYEPIKVEFDCKGSVSGTYASPATGYAYTFSGASVTLPGSGNCVAPSGYTFSGWAD